MTFDDIVVGKFNEMAVYAGYRTLEDNVAGVNPLCIYGDSGVGKTTLLNCIYEKAKSLKKHVVYVTAREFCEDLINSIKHNDRHCFKEEYYNLDLLIIDEIDFFSGKEATTEEFSNVARKMIDDGKKLVVSSLCHPGKIKKLDKSIINLIQSGLICKVSCPDIDSRKTILKKYSKGFDKKLPNDILNLIAETVDNNIFVLIGVYNWASALQELNADLITKSELIETTKDLIAELKQLDNRTRRKEKNIVSDI